MFSFPLAREMQWGRAEMRKIEIFLNRRLIRIKEWLQQRRNSTPGFELALRFGLKYRANYDRSFIINSFLNPSLFV